MEYTKTQDDDCHWYWIPNEQIEDFKTDLSGIAGKDYMESPDAFDTFSQKYEKYRTGGSPDNVPDFFKQP